MLLNVESFKGCEWIHTQWWKKRETPNNRTMIDSFYGIAEKRGTSSRSLCGLLEKLNRKRHEEKLFNRYNTYLQKHTLICQGNKRRQAKATFAWQADPARLIEEKTALGDRLTVWYGACYLWVGLRIGVCVHVGGWMICLRAGLCHEVVVRGYGI